MQRLVLDSSAWREASLVLAYASFGSELSTNALLTTALAEGKRLALPKVAEAEDEGLRLHQVSDLTYLVRGFQGIWEPPVESPVVDIDSVDLALLPGIAFDLQGNRLGYGKGYYDRLLSHRNVDGGCKVWGLAFACQMVDTLPRREHDRRVDLVVCETGIIQPTTG